jgi:hypothetical protein
MWLWLQLSSVGRRGSAGIMTRLRDENRGIVDRFPAMTGYLSLNQVVQNGYGAHPASYSTDSRLTQPPIQRVLGGVLL